MKEKSGNVKIYLYIVISMLCWSFSFIWTKIALESFPPLTLISLRLILASFLLFGFLKLTGRFQRIDKSDLKLFFTLAFLRFFFSLRPVTLKRFDVIAILIKESSDRGY